MRGSTHWCLPLGLVPCDPMKWGNSLGIWGAVQYSLWTLANTHKRSKREGFAVCLRHFTAAGKLQQSSALLYWYSRHVSIPPACDAGYNLPFSHHSGACFSSHYSELWRQRQSHLMNTNIALSYWPVCVPVTQEEKTPYPPGIYSPCHVSFLKAFQGKTSNLLPLLSLQPDKNW